MKYQRIIIGLFLLILLLSLMSYYSFDYRNHDPDTQYILDHWEEFTTTKIAIDAEVYAVQNKNNTLYIAVSPYPQGIIQVKTTESLANVYPGDPVEVYGIFTGKNQMTAEKLLVYEKWKYNLIFIRALPAIPFSLFLFFRTYRFNSNKWLFERRRKHT